MESEKQIYKEKKFEVDSNFIPDFISFFNHLHSNFTQKASPIINFERNRNTKLSNKLKHSNLNETEQICFSPLAKMSRKINFPYVISTRVMRYYIFHPTFLRQSGVHHTK